jgi:dihydrofolate synthase/folylpolyglutamate synthase
MKGDFQFINAATAVGAIEALQSKGFEVPESAIRSGLESAYLPGRLEVLREHPTLLIDGAHNLAGARSLARALKDCFNYDRLFLVIGMVVGHSVDDVVGVLAPMAHRFYATAPDSPRAAPADEIARVAKAHCPDVRIVMPVAEAAHQALRDAGEDDLVCVTGSFYTIHEIARPCNELIAEV